MVIILSAVCMAIHVGPLYISKPECGPIPNLMVALPNIGGDLCSTPQSLADTVLDAVQ